MLFKATWFALFASLGPMLETLGGTGRTLPLLQGGVGAPERQLLGGLMEGGGVGGVGWDSCALASTNERSTQTPFEAAWMGGPFLGTGQRKDTYMLCHYIIPIYI